APDLEASNQLQRKLNTVTSENSRLKAKLELAEKDKDSLKAMVKQLEEQRLSLLDKLEKSSDVGCYPSMDSLVISPHTRLIMTGLAPSTPHFQVKRELQLAQESAQGDSLSREVKPEKDETSFDLSSKLCIREGVTRTSDKGSDSLLYAATVVARLSLDNALAVRASREANSPVGHDRNTSSPLWNGENYAMEQAELAEERAVKESMGYSRRAASKNFATSQDGLGITESEAHGHLHDIHVRRENARNIQSSETEGRIHCEPSLVRANERDNERLNGVAMSSCRQPSLEGTSLQAQGSVEFLRTVTKTGIITKELLTAIPRSGLLGLNGISHRWMSSESFSIRNILGQDSARMVPSVMPVCYEEDRNNGVPAGSSISDAGLSTQVCNSRTHLQVISSAEHNGKQLPVSNMVEVKDVTGDTLKQNTVVTNLATKSTQEFEASQPFGTLQQPKGAGVVSSEKDLNCGFRAGHGESGSQQLGKQGVSSAEGVSSHKLEAKGLSKQLSAETTSTDGAANLSSKVEISEHASDKCSEEETAEGLRDILENLAPNSQKPPVVSSSSGKLSGRGLTARRSCEGRVGSLIKKYSQVNTLSPDASRTSEAATAARKSRSVQIQLPAATREKSQERSPSRTWALDSNGHRTLLTVVSKEIDPFTQVIVYTFQNGDKKDLYPDGKVVYHYAKSRTVHTVYPCGKKEIQFANGQRELHGKDGNIEVTYPNGMIRRVFCTGEEEQEAPDGTVARRLRDGTEIVHYPNGQKEVRHESYRSRSYPDGTVKTVYPSGKQITKYANGRVRVKDANGTVLTNTSS
ncbi:unnamed protein product, partial [Ixodes hexagonus]